VVVTDSLLFGPMIAAASRSVPCAVLIPTVYPAPAAQPPRGRGLVCREPRGGRRAWPR
jgi:hypothetical protein